MTFLLLTLKQYDEVLNRVSKLGAHLQKDCDGTHSTQRAGGGPTPEHTSSGRGGTALTALITDTN